MKATITVHELMDMLKGKEKDLDTIIPLAREYSPLMVKKALLGLASLKRIYNPHWFGAPPSVFLSYKWNGPASRDYVELIHDYLVDKGYHVYFDRNELDETANSFTEVPEYIAHVADCQFYLLVLTEKTADYITGRKGKTSWIFDEYQQAVNLINQGRQLLVPVLVEENGVTDFFTKDMVMNLTKDIYDFSPMDDLFYPVNFKMPDDIRPIYTDFLDGCDVHIIKNRWKELEEWLQQMIIFKNFPDYQFRVIIHSICTKNEMAYNESLKLVAEFLPPHQIARLLKSYAKLYNVKALSDMLI